MVDKNKAVVCCLIATSAIMLSEKKKRKCKMLSMCLKRREESRLRVFENRVLGRIFGPKRDEVTGEWSRVHNEELNYLYSSPNILRVIKSRRMRWAGHVASMGERRGVYRILVGENLRGRYYLEDPCVDRIILR
jgi:hypothetical protein